MFLSTTLSALLCFTSSVTIQGRTYDSRDEWRRNPPHEKILPANVPEESLLLYILRISLARPQPPLGVLPQQLQTFQGKEKKTTQSG